MESQNFTKEKHSLSDNCQALVHVHVQVPVPTNPQVEEKVPQKQRIDIKNRIHPADPGSHVYIKLRGIF